MDIVMRRVAVFSLWACVLAAENRAAASGWRVGVAAVDITPRKPVWLAGYAARSAPPSGTEQSLWAKALVVRGAGDEVVVLVSSDLIGMVREISDRVGERVHERTGIPRERIIFNSSHTHCGPLVRESAMVAYGLEGEKLAMVEAYTRRLEEMLARLIEKASGDLRPGRLDHGVGRATFAMNRRSKRDGGYVIAPNPEGPVDHDVPVLRVTSADGKLLAILFGYACHNTTLGGGFMQYCGDYAGYAQEAVEAAHPGATALFFQGCGGDSNPEPRGELSHARQHGKALAAAVGKVLGSELRPVRGPLRVAFGRTRLDFVAPPSREALEARQDQGNVYQRRLTRRLLARLAAGKELATGYDFPVQVVRFGDDLTILALAGEVVVDYAHRLKKEFPGERLWTMGYSNEVFAYLPSERVLAEGGYEGEGAMVYFGWHGPFRPGVEDNVVRLTRRLLEECRKSGGAAR